METNWINRDLFPFESRFFETSEGHRLHYIDEGSGPVILFSHGTPEWSFGWRDLIKSLRPHFRCVAADLLGMGLSDKPADADYSCEAHSARLEQFIGHLKLKGIGIVANDFGLSIALGYAIRNPDNVQKISIFNGWMWPLNDDAHYAGPGKLFNSWLGRVLYRSFNFPVNVIQPQAFGDKKKLTKEIHRHYKQALPDFAARVATFAFVGELLNAGPWWSALWAQRARITGKPFLIFWGMKDSFVPPYELEKWREAVPNAKIVVLEQAGHFVQEEEPERMAAELGAFFTVQAAVS